MSKKHTVVMLHGWGSTIESWKNQKSFFEKKGYKVLLMKMPGFDLDEPDANWGIPEYAAYVIENLPSNGVKYIFVGHSFGGRVSIYISANYPDRVEKLVLTDAAGINIEPHPGRSVLILFSRVFSTIEKVVPFISSLRGFVRNLIGSEGYKKAQGNMREVMKNVVNLDLQESLPSIKVPTLIIWGSDDNVTPMTMAKAFNQGIKGSTLKIIDGAEHSPHRTHSDEWNDTVLKFISK